MGAEVWILGATGRTGRAVAKRLHEEGVPLVLVGRGQQRLQALADTIGGSPQLRDGTLAGVLAALRADGPRVVLNTVGPFATTAVQVASACPPGTHYVDIANEFSAVEQVLDRRAQAAASGQVLVTAAGFGVLATESLALRVSAGRPLPARLRVDAMASVAIETGVMGEALAGTITQALSFGGRQVRAGRVVRAGAVSEPLKLTAPDGTVFTTTGVATGELLAAWHASGAPAVVAASSMVPTGVAARAALPAASALFKVPGLAQVAARALARAPLRAADRPQQHSWAHARAEWTSGETLEGWLRTGDAMDFTVAVAAEVTKRLFQDGGQPGAYTPGALFGPELAEAIGGEIFVGPSAAAHLG